MGWFDGWFGSSTNSDALDRLDPKLRDFLQRESPIKYQTSQETSAAKPEGHDNATVTEAERPVVPRESLFQDGRYAHLWKSYKPLAEIESENKTDHEKLMDVLEGYKSRKHNIGKAALENCAIQQEEWVNCMKTGAWEDRLQMCRHQVQRFERCYTMQTRLLKALGYQSIFARSPQEEEAIQMHADTLYIQMLEQEKAKQEGMLVPDFKPIIPKQSGGIEPGEVLQKTWKDKLEKLPEDERAAEEAALRADFQVKADVARNVEKIWEDQAAERASRQAGGKSTTWDRVAGAFSEGKK